MISDSEQFFFFPLKYMIHWMRADTKVVYDDDDIDDNDDDGKTSVDRVYANKVVEDTPGLGISGSNPSLAG